jgi:hypothetical protein
MTANNHAGPGDLEVGEIGFGPIGPKRSAPAADAPATQEAGCAGRSALGQFPRAGTTQARMLF